MTVPFFICLIAAVVLGGLYFNEQRQRSQLAATVDKQKRQLQQKEQDLQHSLETREALINAIDDGLILLDANQRVLIANEKAASYGDGKMVGESLIASLRHTEIDEMLNDVAKHGEIYNEQLIAFNDEIRLSVRIERIATNSETSYIMTLRDVTDLKRAQRSRREMVAFLTHDLKTPITVAQLVAETIDDKSFYKQMSKDYKKLYQEKLKDLRQQLAQMSQLVQEMQDLYRIESGQLPILAKSTPILEPIQAGVEHLISLAEDKEQKITVEVDPGIVALIDASKIQRVVNNITHNAIKYTPTGGSITIKAIEDESTVTISIRDTGIGIPPEELSRIFERFFQVDRARNDGSSGLGLAISKHIVKKHGGEIWAESEEGAGTEFFFKLYKDTVS